MIAGNPAPGFTQLFKVTDQPTIAVNMAMINQIARQQQAIKVGMMAPNVLKHRPQLLLNIEPTVALDRMLLQMQITELYQFTGLIPTQRTTKEGCAGRVIRSD
jgi:hypothetical protein